MEKNKNLIKYFIQRNKLKINKLSNEILKLHSMMPTKELAKKALQLVRNMYCLEKINNLISSNQFMDSLLYLKNKNLIFDKNDKEFIKLIENYKEDYQNDNVDKEIISLTNDILVEMVDKYYQALQLKVKDPEVLELEALRERINKCKQ